MITERPREGVRSVTGSGEDGFGGEDLGKDLGLLLWEQRRQGAIDRERELSLYRSGSAPPTVEGSLTAVGGLFRGASSTVGMSDFSGGGNENGFLSEEELRADPAYVSYYYSHVNLNPRLPPPVRSKEDWRLTQRLQTGSSGLGGIGDRRGVDRAMEDGGRSLFSLQPGFSSQNVGVAPCSREWLDKGEDGLIGLSSSALGPQQSFADIFQDDHTIPISGHPSGSACRNTLENGVELLCSAESHLALHRQVASIDRLQPGGNFQSVSGLQNTGVSTSHTFASVLASSLSRSTTPDPQLVARAPSPCLPPVGVRLDATEMKINNSSCSFKGVSSSKVESDDVLAALSGMSLSTGGAIDNEDITQSKLQQEIDDHQKNFFDMHGGQNHSKQHPSLKSSGSRHLSMSSIPQPVKSLYPNSARRAGSLVDMRNSALRPDGQAEFHMSSIAGPNGTAHYQNVGLGGYSPALPSMMAASLPPLFENVSTASSIASLGLDSRTLAGLTSASNLSGSRDSQNLNTIGNLKAAAALQMTLADPLYIQYLKTAGYSAQVAANFGDPSVERGYMGNSYMDLLGIQKAYVGALLQPQEQYGMPFLGKYGASNHAFYSNPAFGQGMTYPGRSPVESPILPDSSIGSGRPLRHGVRNMRFPSGLRNSNGGIMGSWHLEPTGSMEDGFPSSLLEEFKSNKARCFELSEIAGHVVEFSADQYGSRFIQQKLETATAEEKNMVFEEIMPQALSLMTDVFGNYVVQKFFEHGSADQIRELASQLNGHVLALSLQMYGCRVIQKALEVVDLDQQTRMVTELDGHVMRCVRDQNGNHVIQKCIECIPQNAIHFIISIFYDQVVTLSTHPYGCRVIQRVLEHCDDPKTQQIVMDEIMQCVCILAQDQYGNYVIQHVLEHGKPHERSAIIKKLAGQIVKMSQQKFASNVVEKCLTFGGPVERQILVNEMLGSTDENEPLQAMMKDQFANYVVQKVLETCDDLHRELILSRIKVHLNALKKYTYGKHIVARVEKLVTAGERRIGLQSHYSS